MSIYDLALQSLGIAFAAVADANSPRMAASVDREGSLEEDGTRKGERCYIE